MPKISAPTVAEHHAQRRQALISAAVDLLVAEGAAAVTLAAVGARAGLARSSVYQYFESAASLLATVIEETFPRANAALAAAMEEATTPRQRIDAYVTATVRLAAQGTHRPVAALWAAELHPSCRRRLVELREGQAAPLLAAVRDLGAADPELSTDLLGGLVQAAISAAENGTDPDTVIARTLALTHQGLRRSAVRPSERPTDQRTG